MRFKSNLKSSTTLIDMTPLVDVIFLLLIFFIITSDILPLKSLHIENPQIEKNTAPLTTQLLVVMDAQHVIYVGSKKAIVDFASLKGAVQMEISKLKQQRIDATPVTVVLSVDRRVPYDTFLKLFSLIQECTPSIRLAYQSEEENELPTSSTTI